jgi:hypothetical protein
MGTRGVYGFRKNGADKLAYNHYDSYPACLGARMADFCRGTDLAELHRVFDRIELVGDAVKPTRSQIAECAPFTDLEVAGRSDDDWYCLLHKTQGHPEVYCADCRYMYCFNRFIRFSRWCEYGYVVNLDDGALEFWEGLQEQPQPGNRYGTAEDDGYYPCRMALSFPLDNIPGDAVAQMKAVRS